MRTLYTVAFRKLFPFVLVALCLSFFHIGNTSAQVTQYKFTTGSGSTMPASANIIWAGHSNARYQALVSSPISLGFTFKFDGASYSSIIVYASGFISLGSTQQPSNTSNTLNKTTPAVLAPFWGGQSQYTGRASVELSGGSSNNSWGLGNLCGTSPVCQYQVNGSAPNRVMVVEWRNWDVTSTEALSTWQVRLYETSGSFEFFYEHMTSQTVCAEDWGGQNIPTYAAIGIASGNNNFISVTPVNGNSATTSISTASTQINLQTNPISNGTLYKFSSPFNIQLSTSPKILSYGITTAGTTSAPLCMTVRQAGTESNLIINSATITGSSEFTISSTPPSNTYAVGQSGQYCVVFKPTQPGIRLATLNITSNGRDSGTQSIALTGIGAVAEYTIDSTVRFKKTRTRLGDSLTQYVHLTSTGLIPLVVTGLNLTGQDAGQYFISYRPNPIPPGTVDSIGITYAPTLEGKHLATMTIISNSFTHPSLDVSLQGTGILPHIVVTPPILLFDSTREGDTICKTVTIWNPGSDTLRIKSNLFSSNDGDFHYTGLDATNSIIPPDVTRTVTVCFIPIQQGSRQARLELKTNIIKTFEIPRRDTAGTVIMDIRGTGVPFGVFANAVSGSPFIDSALVGTTVCRNDTLKNVGDADIIVTGLSIAGPGSVFSYNGLPPFPFLLKARAFKVFNLCGTPDQKGLLNGLATVTGTTSGDKAISAALPLAIYGINVCASVDPAALFIDTTSKPATTVKVIKGSDSTLCVTVTNCGDVPAAYTASLAGVDKADYAIMTVPNPSVVIAPKGTTQFCVKFTAITATPTNATLVITAPDITAINIPLTGEGVCASFTHTTPEITATAEGDKKQFTFNITNTGNAPWSPGTGSLIGPGAGDYKIIGVVPDPIPAGGQGTVTMEFDPPVGSHGQVLTANVSWPSGSPCQSDTVSVDLSGQSVDNGVTGSIFANGFTLDQSYPNPTAGIANFSYVTPRETEVNISLLDLTGKVVRTLITGRVSEGFHVVNFDVSNLASGTYIYLLQSGSTRLSKELILAR